MVCLIACVAISCVIFSGENTVSFTFKDSHEMDKDMELLSTHDSIGAKLKQDGESNFAVYCIVNIYCYPNVLCACALRCQIAQLM